MIRRPPKSTQSRSSAASDVYKRQDLIGIPLRITVGPKRVAEGKVEVKSRKSGEVSVLPLDEWEVETFLRERISKEM